MLLEFHDSNLVNEGFSKLTLCTELIKAAFIQAFMQSAVSHTHLLHQHTSKKHFTRFTIRGGKKVLEISLENNTYQFVLDGRG